MRTHRWTLAAVALFAVTACQTAWNWKQYPPAKPEGDDLQQHSVQESLEFYTKMLPPRGFYQIFAVPERPDPRDQDVRPYSFVIFRVRDVRVPGNKEPVIERIIGPVRGKEEWTDLFSIFRRYASSPPAGYYCWQDDCRGKYSPPGDPDPRDPYPPELPDHPPTSTSVGYAVTPVPSGAVIFRDEPGGLQRYASSGTGGSDGFVPREGTVLTAGFIEQLRAAARRVGEVLDSVPSVPGLPPSYPPSYHYGSNPYGSQDGGVQGGAGAPGK